VLPGLDANDENKTLATVYFITSVLASGAVLGEGEEVQGVPSDGGWEAEEGMGMVAVAADMHSNSHNVLFPYSCYNFQQVLQTPCSHSLQWCASPCTWRSGQRSCCHGSSHFCRSDSHICSMCYGYSKEHWNTRQHCHRLSRPLISTLLI
jgi:hypothetical protein